MSDPKTAIKTFTNAFVSTVKTNASNLAEKVKAGLNNAKELVSQAIKKVSNTITSGPKTIQPISSKLPSKKDTISLVSNDKNPYGLKPEDFARLISINPNEQGVWTSSPYALQPFFGYSIMFEGLFDLLTRGNNDDKSYSVTIINSKGVEETIVFTMWKGYYLNLGTGAEIASYTQMIEGIDYGPGRKFEMGLKLENTKTGEQIFNMNPELTRWNNGFVPELGKPVVGDLKAIGTINFGEDQKVLYEKFVEQNWNAIKLDKTIIPDDKTFSVQIIF